MSYAILRTDKAEDGLNEIINYIAETNGAGAALNYLDKVEREVLKLAEFPNIGVRPRFSIIKKQGYRVLIVDKTLVFYKVFEDKQTVIVAAIVDGRREYARLI